MVNLTPVCQFVKGLLQLPAFSRGVAALFIELTILSGILWLRRRSGWGWSSEHGMSPNLHKDTHGVGGKSGVDCLELWPPLPRARISIMVIEIFVP